MQAKYCVILLLWLAGSVRGDSSELPERTHSTDDYIDLFTVLVNPFRHEGLAWFSCRRLAGPKIAPELGPFVCTEREDLTNDRGELYVASVKTLVNRDGWVVRTKHLRFTDGNEDGLFVCKRATDFASTRGADYLVYVEPLINKKGISWLVCKRYRLRKFQCRRDSYWSN